MSPLLFLLPVLLAGQSFSQVEPASAVASRYLLSSSTSFSFPQATLDSSSAQAHIVSKWGLSKGRIQNGGPNLDFVADPFPNNPVIGADVINNSSANASASPPGPVLRVQYPTGSFQDNDAGGAQFFAMFNSSGSAFQSMLLTYEVTFDEFFDWVKGGKLPGLRGGPDPNNCSGGNQANGSNCFSSRIMWRATGNGEVYAYVPKVNGICSEFDVQCNDQYGVSIARGFFAFLPGQWNRVTMLVRLNDRKTANGQLVLYFKDVKVLEHDDIYYRATDNITTGGLYFSTFFGGSDSSWASTNLTHTYFRNIQLFAGTNPSNLEGSRVKDSDIKPKNAAQGRVQMFIAGPVVIACSVLSLLYIS